MVKNRIPGLIERLNRVQSRQSINSFVTNTGTAIGERVLLNLRRNQPVGSTEPDYETRKGTTVSHGRPSHRLYGAGSDIGSSWLAPEIGFASDGGQVTISSTAPHIEYVIDKAKPHSISGSRGLSFWWGSPLRWSPSRIDPGAQLMSGVNHPGHPGNPFVDRSIEDARPQNLEELRRRMSDMWQPVRSFLA